MNRITLATWTSSGSPSSSAPRRRSSRETARANALSFIFLITDDVGLSTRVRTALLNDPQVAAGQINVRAANGVVTLSGNVRTAAERDRAVALARQTSGVSDVRSELAVTQP